VRKLHPTFLSLCFQDSFYLFIYLFLNLFVGIIFYLIIYSGAGALTILEAMGQQPTATFLVPMESANAVDIGPTLSASFQVRA
jgi:hypothetical protein